MIISASRRTDIPAFYSKWFMNRLKAGYALVPNPFNPKNIYRVSLEPEDVDAIVFWTRDPRMMMPELKELDSFGFRYYFQFTLTHYGRALEPFAPPIAERIYSFKRLSDYIGPEKVVWRYDPIIISNRTNYDFHLQAFERLSAQLQGNTERVMISFCSWYRKTTRRVRRLEKDGWSFNKEPVNLTAVTDFLAELSTMAASRGMKIYSCADGNDYFEAGIDHGSCIDASLINSLWALDLPAKKDPGQREHCLCAPSKDIGAKDTCVHGCLYCYSTIDNTVAAKRHDEHNPESESLG